MAILKHKISKNARYADVLDYYMYRHQEDEHTGHYEPILDEYGLMIERDFYAVCYITADGREANPELWAAACMRTNIAHQKNTEEGDIKNHEYIIAHPEDDMPNLTQEDLMEEGKAFARKYLQGYDTILGVHRNHVHITINSVRALQRDPEDWMKRDESGDILPCEIQAGGKHQNSAALQHDMHDWLLQYTQEHGWVAKDNNAIAAARRAERHGSKNDLMRTALLECASRSRNMSELQTLLKEDYDMDLKVSYSGKTLSVLFPGNTKYVRLRTLDLDVTDLTHHFNGSGYIFTKEDEAQQTQKEIEAKEKKKYAEWLKDVRARNNDRAESTAARAEFILAQELRSQGERYSKEEFQDIRYLIRQTSYVSSNLQTELEKVDRLLDRWNQYLVSTPCTWERRQHEGYVRWCGCDPDSAEELDGLRAEREVILAQKAHADALNEALLSDAERWRGINNLTYAENNLAWAKQREKQLKHQLKNIKASRKKLWEIVYTCEGAALRYDQHLKAIGRKPKPYTNHKWANVFKFRKKLAQAMERERECKAKLRDIKRQKKEAKVQVRHAKKTIKEQNPAR